jgi:hypothetical protein
VDFRGLDTALEAPDWERLPQMKPMAVLSLLRPFSPVHIGSAFARFGENAPRRSDVPVSVGLATAAPQNPEVIVVDEFRDKHGHWVSGIIQKALPKANIKPWQVERGPDGHYMIGKALVGVLDYVRKEAKQGKVFSAINISMGTRMRLVDLKTRLGLPDTLLQTGKPEELNAVKADIAHRMAGWVSSRPNMPFSSEPDEKESGEDIVAGIGALSALATEYRIPTFVAGGGGAENVNLYTLARNIHGVGVLKTDGADWEHNPQNPFITIKALGEHELPTSWGGTEHVPLAPSFATPQALVNHHQQLKDL